MVFKLKRNCSKISFANIEKSQENLEKVLYGFETPEQIHDELTTLYRKLDYNETDLISLSLDEKISTERRIEYLNNLQSDATYQSNLLPEGLEGLILGVIETYSFWRSLRITEQHSIFSPGSYLFEILDAGINNLICTQLGKLTSTSPGDFSLYNVWAETKHQLRTSEITDAEEIEAISIDFDRQNEDRNPHIKRFTNFRNKTIAHNNRTEILDWNDFKETMHFALRTWALIDKLFSPNFFPRPVQLDESIYTPVSNIVSKEQLSQMKSWRKTALDEIFDAASTNWANKNRDNLRPFGRISISASITFSKK